MGRSSFSSRVTAPGPGALPGLGLGASVLLHGLVLVLLTLIWWRQEPLPETVPVAVEIVVEVPRRLLRSSSAPTPSLPAPAAPRPAAKVPLAAASALRPAAPPSAVPATAPKAVARPPAAVRAPAASTAPTIAVEAAPAVRPKPPLEKAVAPTLVASLTTVVPPSPVARAEELAAPVAAPIMEPSTETVGGTGTADLARRAAPAGPVAVIPAAAPEAARSPAVLPRRATTPAMAVAQAALVDAEAVRRDLAARTADFPCSRLEVAVREDLSTVVHGRVESRQDLARLRDLAAGLPAAGEPELAVEVLEAPFCMALDLVEPIASTAGGSPVVALNSVNGIFHVGDYVVVTVEVPADVAWGHLHVVYLDLAGKVVHLLPNAFATATTVQGGQRVRLGVEANERRAGVRDYQVTPPFGRGVVLALLSPVPLPGVGAREVETVAELLASLRMALAAVPPGSLRIARVRLVTGA